VRQNFKEKYYYIYKLLSDCLPIYPLYIILFREQGLSITEISLLLSFWSLVELLSEVPSGIIADRWNRKYMLFIAVILKAVCFTIWVFSNTFWLFALGFLFWGISGAFSSGTEEGLIYDNLKSENRENDFGKIYGKGRFFSSIGIIIGVISGGLLAHFININTISIISIVVLTINLFFITMLKEKNYYSERLEKESIHYFKTLFEAISICSKNIKIFLGMILLVLVISVVVAYTDEFDPLIIDDFGLGYIWVSIIFLVRFGFIALGERFAAVIEQKIKTNHKVFILAGIACILFLLFSVLWNQYIILIFGLFCMIMTIAELIQITVIQNEIDEEGRATIMSIYNLFQNLAMIVFCTIYAALSNAFSLRICYILISLYCMFGVVVLFLILPDSRKNNV